MNIFKKLYIFQKERFPLQILIFTTLATVLSSAAVSQKDISVVQILVAFFSTMFFLFHIRVIDESRDFDNDFALHIERPVQRGLITIKQLFAFSITGVFITVLFSLYCGLPSFILTLSVITFTTLAWKDFFVKQYFTGKPVLYHIINSPQMILIQWNIFAIYTNSFHISLPMLLQALLTYNCIFIIELVRKIRIPEAETSDTYSSVIGIKKTTNYIIALILSTYILIGILLQVLGILSFTNIMLCTLISALAIGTIIVHKRMLKSGSEKLLILVMIIYYISINLIIYFSTL